MLSWKSVFVLALAGAAVPAVFASSGSIWMGAERGLEPHAAQSTSNKTRADVKNELEAFRKNPVTADGGTWTGTDNDNYLFAQHSYTVQDGQLAHTDGISHDSPQPGRTMTEAERRRLQGR